MDSSLIRDRILGRIIPSYRKTLARARAFDVALREMPELFAPERLAEQLDQETLDYILQQRGYVSLWGDTGSDTDWDNDFRRDYIRRRSRFMYREDATVRLAVNMWTSFGFGNTVKVRCHDPRVQPVWDAFWESRANASLLGTPVVSKLSTRLLVDGELFLVYFISKIDGAVRVRRIAPEQISRFITLPDDPDIVVYYERISTWGNNSAAKARWYRDWRATPDELRAVPIPRDVVVASDENPATDVVCQSVILPSLGRRGEPMMATGLPWAQAYREFLEDRRTLAHAVAAMLEDVKVKGGSRAVNLVKSYLQSTLASDVTGIERNPPPAAGSSFVHNENVEITRRPLDTGASSAQMDGMMLLGQAGAGLGGLPPMWLGRTDATQNRSVAEVSIMPTLKAWEWYRMLWEGVFSDMSEIVLDAAEKWPLPHEIGDKGVDVIMERPFDADLGSLADVVLKMFNGGIIDARLALQILLRMKEFGVRDPEDEIERLAPLARSHSPTQGGPNANPQVAQAVSTLKGILERIAGGSDVGKGNSAIFAQSEAILDAIMRRASSGTQEGEPLAYVVEVLRRLFDQIEMGIDSRKAADIALGVLRDVVG